MLLQSDDEFHNFQFRSKKNNKLVQDTVHILNYSHNYNVMVGRDIDGAETYRISELAALAGVTKRTVDYYTNLGLLTPARSCSNYRYYDENALKRLIFIVDCKKQRLALSDIKDRLENQFPSSAKLDDEIGNLALEIDHMNQNISGILHRFERLKPEDRDKLKSKLPPEKLAAFQSFMLLLS